MGSLLAEFYTKIRGSQEDIASLGIARILNKSLKARKTFSFLLSQISGDDFSELKYIGQKVNKDKERPDIVGIDEDGKEKVIIETKFWSSLTENQPNKYLKDLTNNGILMFIVPSLRKRIIFTELIRKAENEFEIKTDSEKDDLIFVKEGNKYILIKTWEEVFNLLKQALIEENNTELISDVDQLIGFYEVVETESFKPVSDEDISPKIARKIVSYYDLTEKIVNELKKRGGSFNTKNLLSRSKRYGHQRYFRKDDFGFAVCVEFELWAKQFDSPFWLYIQKIEGKDWVDLDIKDKKKLESYAIINRLKYIEKDSGVYISLITPLNKTEDETINDFVEQIINIVEVLGKNN